MLLTSLHGLLFNEEATALQTLTVDACGEVLVQSFSHLFPAHPRHLSGVNILTENEYDEDRRGMRWCDTVSRQ